MIQRFIPYMKDVRSLADHNIIFTDEKIREAGIKGAKAGEELRKIIMELIK